MDTFRISRNATVPDFRVRIADGATHPDLRLQVVDKATAADFVLIDDGTAGASQSCRSSKPARTVTLDSGNFAPDVTVDLSAGSGDADYKIYVRSQRYSQRDAAALLAAIWKAERRREAAAIDRSKSADRIRPASTMVAVTPAR